MLYRNVEIITDNSFETVVFGNTDIPHSCNHSVPQRRMAGSSSIYIYIYICVPTYVLAVVKYADGFPGVPRISPVLGRTVSGSTFTIAIQISSYVNIHSPRGPFPIGLPVKILKALLTYCIMGGKGRNCCRPCECGIELLGSITQGVI